MSRSTLAIENVRHIVSNMSKEKQLIVEFECIDDEILHLRIEGQLQKFK